MFSYNASHAIINPASSAGYVGRHLPEIRREMERHLGTVDFTLTEYRGHGELLARSARERGVDFLVVVGGDGTLSETVNGLLSTSAGEMPRLFLLNAGTGGDFSRTLGISSDLSLSLQKLAGGREIAVDAGWCSYRGPGGETRERYFVNVAGCGLPGEVVRHVNRYLKQFGAFSYYLGALERILFYRNTPVRIRTPSGESVQEGLVSLAICNGQYFGGGMAISPDSDVTDGLFHVTLIKDWNLLEKVMSSRSLYDGTLPLRKGVSTFTTEEIYVEPVTPRGALQLDMDGENPGTLPLHAKILPGVIRMIL